MNLAALAVLLLGQQDKPFDSRFPALAPAFAPSPGASAGGQDKSFDSRFPALAQDKLAWKGDLDAGLAEAKRTGKYAVLFFSGPKCPEGDQMEAETFTNVGVIAYSNKNLVSVALRTDKHKELARKFEVKTPPGTVLLSPEGQRVASWGDFLGPDEYLRNVDRAVFAHKKLKEVEPRVKFKPDDPDLLAEAAGLYADLGNGRKAADHLKRAAAKAPDPKVRGELLVRAFKHLNELDSDEKLNGEILALADDLEKLEAPLGFQDDAAFARAMVEWNRAKWDELITKLEAVWTRFPDGDRAPTALYMLGERYHHAKKDNAKAEKALKTLIEKYPKSELADTAKAFLEHLKVHADK